MCPATCWCVLPRVGDRPMKPTTTARSPSSPNHKLARAATSTTSTLWEPTGRVPFCIVKAIHLHERRFRVNTRCHGAGAWPAEHAVSRCRSVASGVTVPERVPVPERVTVPERGQRRSGLPCSLSLHCIQTRQPMLSCGCKGCAMQPDQSTAPPLFGACAFQRWPNPHTTDGLPYIRKDGKLIQSTCPMPHGIGI